MLRLPQEGVIQNVAIHLEKHTKSPLWRDILNCTPSRGVHAGKKWLFLYQIAQEDTANRIRIKMSVAARMMSSTFFPSEPCLLWVGPCFFLECANLLLIAVDF